MILCKNDVSYSLLFYAMLTFVFSSLQSIKDGAVKAISEHCKQLEFLCVSGCSQLTDVTLQYLGASCHELRYLN